MAPPKVTRIVREWNACRSSWKALPDFTRSVGSDAVSNRSNFACMLWAPPQKSAPVHPNILKQERERMERLFVRRRGLPAAIISKGKQRVIRTRKGEYFVERQRGNSFLFARINKAKGKVIERDIASGKLDALDSKFQTGSAYARYNLKMTTTPGLPYSPANEAFAGKKYVRGNPNARIAYRSAGTVARYYLGQFMNGCLAATILNGAVFAGIIKRENGMMLAFYDKLLKSSAHAGSGRINMLLLASAISRGKIPGLSMRTVSRSRVATLTKQRIPVMIGTPHFAGHVMHITAVNKKGKTARAVDTVSGMELTVDLTTGESVDSNMKPCMPGLIGSGPICMSKSKWRYMFALLGGASNQPPVAFFSIRIKNARQFKKWLGSYGKAKPGNVPTP